MDDWEIIEHNGLFGISREDWDAIKADIPPRDVEKRFEQNPEDGILIYQLKDTVPRELFFAGSDELKNAPNADNYKAVYTQPLYNGGSKGEVLEKAYAQFNIYRPADFTGHSLSTSDIVAIKRKAAPRRCGFSESVKKLIVKLPATEQRGSARFPVICINELWKIFNVEAILIPRYENKKPCGSRMASRCNQIIPIYLSIILFDLVLRKLCSKNIDKFFDIYFAVADFPVGTIWLQNRHIIIANINTANGRF